MTLNFIPGEVNKSDTSVLQGRWKHHFLIVYGSGNNLVITSTTFKGQISDHLQTIYLEADPQSVDLNTSNGIIAICVKSKIILFKPLNEYMTKPQWSQCLEIPLNCQINCLNWAPVENEIVCGTQESIELFKIYEEYGNYTFKKRWYSSQASPVTSVKITYNSNKIVAKHGEFDRLLKVWSRINYGDDNTLFELRYLPHPKDDFIQEFKWRFRLYRLNPVIDGSMANIKNIRNYIDLNNEDSDTLFTLSHNKVMRVWSTYETGGHNQIRCWGQLDLKGCFENQEIVGVLLIDNYYLQKTLFSQLDQYDSDLARYFKNQRYDNVDLLLVISDTGQVAIYLILNVSMIPPNSIQFERIDTMAMEFDTHSFLKVSSNNDPDSDILSKEVQVQLRPVIIPKISLWGSNEDSLSILFHNRIKNTVKFNSLDFRKFLTPNSSLIGTSLLNKFQGHEKSIRKLVKSYKSNHNSVILSLLNFAKYNYIWEPLVLGQAPSRTTITKKFQIDLTVIDPNPDNIVVDALILNNIEVHGDKKRHLVITFDKLGYFGVWDCDEAKNEDQCAGVLESHHVGIKKPKVLQLVETAPNEYLVMCIYELNDIKGWKIKISPNFPSGVVVSSCWVDDIPFDPSNKNYQINRIENLINSKSLDLITVMDREGLLKNFSIKADENIGWLETFTLNTSIKNCSKIMGSSIINKLALVDETGSRLYIFDLKASVLEFEEQFDETWGKIRDIDWCLVSSEKHSSHNVLLSVGFQKTVVLYTQLRYDYTNHIPPYASIKTIDVSDYTSHEIGDSLWINNGYLVIGCGNQFFIDDRRFVVGSSSDNVVNNMSKQLIKGYLTDEEQSKELVLDISEIVRILNGPLPYYHPQFLIQLLYMNEINIVKHIAVTLFQKIRKGENIEWNLDFDLLDNILMNSKIKTSANHTMFDESENDDIFNTFNESLIDLLSENLTKVSLPLVTRHQQITLISLINITKIVNKYIGMLDENGIRFLMGFKLFQMSTTQTKLNMRDIVFALHSENKDILFSIIDETYSSKFTLELVKNLGLVYWLDNFRLLEIIENLARNEFNQERDPSGLVSLLYMALDKKQILVGLWKTVSHKEKDKILHFLSNDFSTKRWQVAAMKNAFALLGKHRYLDSAYFFLLADKVTDCCNIIANKLGDFQLALMISKLYNFVRKREIDNKNLIENYLVKDVIEEGNKWTNSWIFWELDQKDVSIQALIKPPIDVILASDLQKPRNYKLRLSSNTFLNDDPALILLYNSIKEKSINYHQGSSSISLNEETKFQLKICSIYDKMGCDYLALILLRSWVFDYRKSTGKSISTISNTGDGFEDFKVDNDPPPQQVFEEPDMSAFDFGF